MNKPRGSTQILTKMLEFAWPHRRYFMAAALLIPLAAGLQMLQPYLIKVAIDTTVRTGNVQGLLLWSALYLLLVLLESAGSYAQGYVITIGAQRALQAMRLKLLKHILRLPVSYFDRNSVGVLVTRLTSDVENLNELFVSGIVAMIKECILLVAITVALFSLNFKLALYSFILMPPLFWVIVKLQRQLRLAFDEMRRAVGRMNGFLTETMAGLPIVKIFGREKKNLDEFNQLNQHQIKNSMISARADALLYAIVEAAGSITLALVVWFAAGPKMAITFGTLVAFIEYLKRFFEPLQDLSGKFSILQMAISSGNRLMQVLDEPQEIEQRIAEIDEFHDTAHPLSIDFHNIELAYENGPTVLHDVSLQIPAGKRYALVGPTGSGKTSLARLLLRFYQPQQGQVILQANGNALNIDRLPLKRLRQVIGIIPQEVALFSGTIAENITMGAGVRDPAIREKLQQIFVRLGLQERFSLDTVLSERGRNLSAGEQQLIAFARILYYDPQVVVLDEATSNIDVQTEKQVQQALAITLQNRTALLIAHRLTTLQDADQIVVMHKGAIVAAGNHQELQQESALYKAMVQEYVGLNA